MTHVFVGRKRPSRRSGVSQGEPPGRDTRGWRGAHPRLGPRSLAGRLLAATFVASVALTGCGGGHAAKPSTGNVQATSSSSRPATSTVTATGTTPPAAEAYWPYNKLVARLDGRTLPFPNEPVRLDDTLLECAGHGPSRRIGVMRRWSRYTCTQTLFRGGVDRDVTFDVTILNATQLRISSERYGAD
jgi:hypothetical protein